MRFDQGIAALDRGDYVELETGAALQRYVAELTSSPARAGARKRRR